MRLRRLATAITMTISPCIIKPQGECSRQKRGALDQVSCGPANQAVSVGNYQVRLVEVPAPEINDQPCRAYLVDRDGNQILLLEDLNVSIHQGTREDIFGDGAVSLILEAYSGGAHCCFTYRIVRLGE